MATAQLRNLAAHAVTMEIAWSPFPPALMSKTLYAFKALVHSLQAVSVPATTNALRATASIQLACLQYAHLVASVLCAPTAMAVLKAPAAAHRINALIWTTVPLVLPKRSAPLATYAIPLDKFASVARAALA